MDAFGHVWPIVPPWLWYTFWPGCVQLFMVARPPFQLSAPDGCRGWQPCYGMSEVWALLALRSCASRSFRTPAPNRTVCRILSNPSTNPPTQRPIVFLSRADPPRRSSSRARPPPPRAQPRPYPLEWSYSRAGSAWSNRLRWSTPAGAGEVVAAPSPLPAV